MITDPWFYAAAIPALMITGISKAGFGNGLGIIAVPFYRICYGFLFVTGAKLLYDGAIHLW